MPRYVSSGLCEYNSKEYRFLVMDRYAKDLQCFLNQSSTHQINEVGSLCLTRQILYALEYIHKKGYTHGDVKGANVMLKNDSDAYVVDFGLACRFMRDDVHMKYEIKPERKHNGTIEYTSRDAHNGARNYFQIKLNKTNVLTKISYFLKRFTDAQIWKYWVTASCTG